MGNSTSVSTAKPTSIDSCKQLVTAYIKQIDETIFKQEYIIPNSIINLCLTFYHPTMIMLWINHIPQYSSTTSNDDTQHPLYMTDINNPNKSWKCSVYDLPSNTKNNNDNNNEITNTKSSWNMYCNAVCLAKNINHCLPNNIINSIHKYYQSNRFDFHYESIKRSLQSNPYNIIFKSGGLLDNQHATDHCNAIIFNNIEFQKSNDQS